MKRLAILGTAAAALLLAACAPKPGIEVTRVARMTATVTSVDPATRTIGFETADGGSASFVAGPEVRNFAQIEPGDVATMELSGTVTVRPLGGLAGPEAEALAVIARAEEGAMPGGLVGTATTLTVTFVAYDPTTTEATLQLPDGAQVVVPVQPEMQEFAMARTPGERLELTFSDAVAVFVEPAA
jgi:hypothetical protein